MRIYYITEKNNKKDILFWDVDMKIGRKKIGCLAFFYKREFALQYKNYLEKIGEEDLVIRSVKI